MKEYVETKFEKWLAIKLGFHYILWGWCFKIGYHEVYYDGMHKTIHLGIFYIGWGT